jgi:beta-lactamase superfamily II metal-dependent hydrolase
MTAVVNTGEGLALVDCGGNQTGQAVHLIRNLSCNLLAEPRLAVLTAPEERYFNDVWALVESFPEVEFATGPAFQLQATAYEPAGRFVQDASLRKRFWTAGGIFSVGKVRFQLLYPPDSDKTLCDGGAVLVTCRTRQILVATNLSDLACRLMGINYPHLRADTLILKGKIPLSGLETLIERAGIRQIVLQGIFHKRERFRLEKIAEEHHLRLIGDKASSGFLINLS